LINPGPNKIKWEERLGLSSALHVAQECMQQGLLQHLLSIFKALINESSKYITLLDEEEVPL
jgi:hypothetical protein